VEQDMRELVLACAAATTEAERSVLRTKMITMGEAALPTLLAALNDSEAAVRRGGGRLLVEMARAGVGLAGAVIVGQLCSLLLLDSSAEVRAEAADALRIAPPGEQHRRAMDALLTALDDDAPQVRKVAALALGDRMEHKATDKLALLIETDPAEEVRGAAAAALAHLDYAAVAYLGENAITALLSELDDPDVPPVYAIRALGILGIERAVEPLIGLLSSDTRARTRREVCQALAHLGDARAIPALEALLKVEQDADVRAAAQAALVEIREGRPE